VEPGGAECFYDRPSTPLGGRMSADVQGGYGPERYTLKRAAPGAYRVLVREYASDRNRAMTRTRVHATICRGWGTPGEETVRKVVDLGGGERIQEIATVTVGG
jgi:Ca-activated chloride channel family protein